MYEDVKRMRDGLFKAKCSKCGTEFVTKPGELNSTGYLGKVSMLYGSGGFLPQCPACGNWRDNRLLKNSRQLTEPLSF